MKQTTVQINKAISTYSDVRIARLGTNFLIAATTMRAAAPKGHEGHVMPMSPKPPTGTPANEKVKPKAPPPAAKQPAKNANR